MAERTPIDTDRAPAAVGPYSQGIMYGDLLFCSGQIPLDPDTGELIEGDITAQARRCLDNLDAVCRAADTKLTLAVRTTVYLTNMDDWAGVNQAYEEFFGAIAPARVAIGVAALPKGASVEIDAIVAV